VASTDTDTEVLPMMTQYEIAAAIEAEVERMEGLVTEMREASL
jgi:hypothetical protein